MNGHRLRQGHHEPRNLWEYPADTPPESKSGHCAGQVFNLDLAAEIVNAVNAARESAQASKMTDPGNLSGSLVADLQVELADILGVKPEGHSLTGDYAALKPDAERLARVVEAHYRARLSLADVVLEAVDRVHGTERAGPDNREYCTVCSKPHPCAAKRALARARELAQE